MELVLNIASGPDSDDEEKAQLTRQLRNRLLELNELERVEAPAAPAQPGAKSVPIDWQTLIVTLAASGGVLTTLIGVVQSWLTRQDRASVTLEVSGDKLTISGASSETQRRLVQDWVKRHKQ
jgi:hypothetical protein